MKEKGMVLVSVLLVMNLMSLFLLLGLETSSLEKQMSGYQLEMEQAEQSLQIVLLGAFKTLRAGQLHCVIHALSANELLNKETAWWKSGATCQAIWRGKKLQYVVEPLQEDPCLAINDHVGVQYWRMTVRSENAFNHATRHLLQATVALPTQLLKRCRVTVKSITSYWQSWRQIK